ncbi:MAG: NosD domain-containing protein [Candidatus Bathyarchaeia archaeon]
MMASLTIHISFPATNYTNEIIVKEGESIQAAINFAPPDSKIIIMPGNYYEQLEINKTLTIIGYGNKTVILGSGTSTCVKISRGVTCVVLANLTIDGTGTYKSTGLLIQQSNNNQIKNVTITNFYKGLRIYDSTQNVLRNVRMLNNTYNLEVYGLYLSHFIHDIDTSNTVNCKKVYYLLNAHNIKLTGDIGFAAIVNSTNIVVVNTALSDNFSGLLLAYTNDTLVYSVNCTRNIQGIRLVNSHNVTITNSSLTLNEWSGISLEPATTCQIYSNIFKFNTHALYFSFSPHILQLATKDNKVFLNDIFDNSVGLYIDEVGGNKICNNNFVRNGIAIKIDDASGNIFIHNNFLENAKDVEFVASSFSNVTNTWDYGYPYGGNFWLNYNMTDDYKGPSQDVDGSDGILDKPCSIGFNNIDKYPLSSPVTTILSVNFEQHPFEVFGFFTEIFNFDFEPTFCRVSFNIVTDTASSFCRIGISKFLLWADNDKWEVLLNDSRISCEIFSSLNYTFLYFNLPLLESGSILEVKVLGTGAIPEYSFIGTSVTLLFMTFLIILFMLKVVKKSLNKPIISKMVVVVLLFMALQGSIYEVHASFHSTRWVLVVGEDGFKTIREALACASDGDRILVRAGIYREQVIINKSLELCGEGLEKTIIETNSTVDAVIIVTNNVSVQCFTIRNFGGVANSCGIRLINASNCEIEDNLVEGKFIGIRLENSSCRNTVKNNILRNNHYGMFLMRRSSQNTIFNNSILSSGWNGIELAWYSNNNVFEANNIINNEAYGIEIPIYSPSYGNIIFHNNFLNNSLNNSLRKHASDFFNNSWFYNGEGNFWDDNSLLEDSDKDGISDYWYYINEQRKICDKFPLMGEFRVYKFLNETISLISSSRIKFLNVTLYDEMLCLNVCLFENRPNGFLRLNFSPRLFSHVSQLYFNNILSIKTWSSIDNKYIYVEYPCGDISIWIYGITEIPELNLSILFYAFFAILLTIIFCLYNHI